VNFEQRGADGESIHRPKHVEHKSERDARRNLNCLVPRSRRVRGAYFADLLVTLFDGNIEFSVPDGGLAFWVKFTGIQLDRLTAAVMRGGVAILPASSLTIEPQTIDAARLGFASMTVEELRRATHRLNRVFSKILGS
jgi:DNA-binding transcriptional MocR family regulator